MSEFVIRVIARPDNVAISQVIRTVMPEFNAVGPGYAINDPEVDDMYSAYQGPRARYFVVEKAGTVLGGGGFAALKGALPGVCEVQKMYLYPAARGHGVGNLLLTKILKEAKASGFTFCYLETLASMTSAVALYLKAGFKALSGAMGHTGHHGCNAWYGRDL